jgi:hypothetical protein
MKNKKLTYLLGAVVIIVWGLILYRVFDVVKGDDDTMAIAPVLVKEPFNDYEVPKDTAHLLLNYRDPFGLVKQKDTVAPTPAKKPGFQTISAIKPATNWSFISYSGYIRNAGSKKLIAIMHINGRELMMNEGETADQVKLIQNRGDSIKINYHGKTKFIVIKPAS